MVTALLTVFFSVPMEITLYINNHFVFFQVTFIMAQYVAISMRHMTKMKIRKHEKFSRLSLKIIKTKKQDGNHSGWLEVVSLDSVTFVLYVRVCSM